MKTSMQELIDRLEEHLVQSAKGQLLTKRGGDYRIGLRKAIDFANESLEKERNQIEGAYNSAKNYPDSNCDGKKYYFMNYVSND